MKYLHLISRFERGGQAQTITELINTRPKSESLVGCSAIDDGFLREKNVPFVHIPLYPSTPRNLLLSCLALRDVVTTFSPEIIHSHHRFASLAGRIVSRFLNVPFVTTVHDLAEGHAYLTKWALGSTVSLFSDAVADHVVREFGVSRGNIHKAAMAVRAMPEPTEEARIAFRAGLGCGVTDPVAVFAGRLVEEKGPHFLLEAIPSVLKRCPDARFWFAGDGEMRSELESRARHLGVDRRIAFLGWLPDAQFCLGCADVVVVPSIREGLGRSAIEALLAMKPVVASAVGGLVEVVRECGGGVLIEPRRPELIADAVSRLFSDREHASALGRLGRAEVIRRFTIDAMVKDFLAIYEIARERQHPTVRLN